MFLYAIIVSKIVYSISCWYSFLVKTQIAQIKSSVQASFKYGYVKSVTTVEELLESYMMTSFSIKHPTVTIAFITSYLLPSLLIMHYAMLDNGHGLLIDPTSELHKRTFINIILFSNCN